ncbi:MAG: hypothetical protein R3249_01120 [Nitriliruptorales bacterium]|nr:hypothetical protein [Nitriliruptorales bacterium]
MKPRRKRFALLLVAAAATSVMAGPAVAGDTHILAAEETEHATTEDGHATEEGERDKIQLPASSHHKVGAIILIASGILGLLVLDNIRRRLKGEGEKATGEFRWR